MIPRTKAMLLTAFMFVIFAVSQASWFYYIPLFRKRRIIRHYRPVKHEHYVVAHGWHGGHEQHGWQPHGWQEHKHGGHQQHGWQEHKHGGHQQHGWQEHKHGGHQQHGWQEQKHGHGHGHGHGWH